MQRHRQRETETETETETEAETKNEAEIENEAPIDWIMTVGKPEPGRPESERHVETEWLRIGTNE